MRANVCTDTTIRDVASVAGVSISTVSRSLNGSTLIPERTRRRVREAADRLGFEFNAHARSLVTRRVGTIGIILPPEYDRFGVNLYHGTLHNAVRGVLERNDIDLLVTFLHNRFTGQDNVRRLVMRKKIDGLIIMQPAGDGKLIDFLQARELPFVFSHYPPPEGCRSDIHLIYPDNEQGGYLAARHLAARRARGAEERRAPGRVLCLGPTGEQGGELAHECQLRVAGFRRGLAESGLQPEILSIGAFDLESAYEALRALGRRIAEFDGLFALNDLCAIGALQALREQGLRIPRDIAVVGYDDTDLAACLRLTTVHQPREELSLLTCERLIELIRSRWSGSPVQGERRQVLAPRLVVRETG